MKKISGLIFGAIAALFGGIYFASNYEASRKQLTYEQKKDLCKRINYVKFNDQNIEADRQLILSKKVFSWVDEVCPLYTEYEVITPSGCRLKDIEKKDKNLDHVLEIDYLEEIPNTLDDTGKGYRTSLGNYPQTLRDLPTIIKVSDVEDIKGPYSKKNPPKHITVEGKGLCNEHYDNFIIKLYLSQEDIRSIAYEWKNSTIKEGKNPPTNDIEAVLPQVARNLLNYYRIEGNYKLKPPIEIAPDERLRDILLPSEMTAHKYPNKDIKITGKFYPICTKLDETGESSFEKCKQDITSLYLENIN